GERRPANPGFALPPPEALSPLSGPPRPEGRPRGRRETSQLPPQPPLRAAAIPRTARRAPATSALPAASATRRSLRRVLPEASDPHNEIRDGDPVQKLDDSLLGLLQDIFQHR